MIELIALRVVHILGAMFWVGSALFTVLFLSPALKAAGPVTASTVMAALQAQRLFTVLPIVGVLTIATGARLMWMTSGGLSPAYFALPMGRMLTLAALLAIVAFAVARLVVRPAAARVMQLAATMQPLDATRDAITHAQLSAQLVATRTLYARGSVVAMLLAVLSAVGMSAARYLR